MPRKSQKNGEGASSILLAPSPGADPTGFEPAVSGVTGRRVRPLHYGSSLGGPSRLAPHGKANAITEQSALSTAGAPIIQPNLRERGRVGTEHPVVAPASRDAALIEMLEDREHIFARRPQEVARLGDGDRLG